MSGKARWFELGSAGSIGIEIAVAIVLGWLGGRWLEREVTHWAPWTTMLGLGVGIAAAAKAILRMIRQHEQDVARRRGGDGGV